VLTSINTTGTITAAEFFAGIGLVRVGLESAGIDVVFANDIEASKHEMYAGHFGEDASSHFVVGDIGKVKGKDLPGIDLAWASFPCTDLSLAGNRKGLVGVESGTFWEFTRILDEMEDERPAVVALENVVGLATSHNGDDLVAAIRELNRLDYSVDVLTLDARRFVPQSRPRLFLVGAQVAPEDVVDPNSELRPDWLQIPYGDPTLRMHRAKVPAPPAPMTSGLGEVVERQGVDWWDEERTRRFIDSLSDFQADRLMALRRQKSTTFRTAYRRTRNGVAVWEVRPDDISGCLRTARGGSSKQAVVRVGHGKVSVRWMTPREYARLMGADDYAIDDIRPNQVLFGFGDAVCVPVVGWLAENYLVPLVRGELAPGMAGRSLRAV
jgi:DNA (cytosine-5)-methyltransferase 1